MKNDWTTTIDSMRDCLEERARFIKKLIAENVKLQKRIEQLEKGE